LLVLGTSGTECHVPSIFRAAASTREDVSILEDQITISVPRES